MIQTLLIIINILLTVRVSIGGTVFALLSGHILISGHILLSGHILTSGHLLRSRKNKQTVRLIQRIRY